MAPINCIAAAIVLAVSASKPAAHSWCNKKGFRVAMGRGGMEFWNGTERDQVVPFEGMVTWAVEVPGLGLALCNEPRSVLSILDAELQLVDISLAPLSDPVGAIFFEGMVYVACFGAQTEPGIAVVNPFTRTLEATYPFPRLNGDKLFVHNVYAFNWDGRPEIFAALLGNPWETPPVSGKGLVRLDLSSGRFIMSTTTEDIHARAAVQQLDGVFYVITQEPQGAPTKLARLERQGDTLAVTATTSLPARPGGGDGGADVLLGSQPNTLFCTDRTAGLGMLYYYTFSGGSFHFVNSRETGRHPRYTTIVPNSGDVVVCNREDTTITTFEGLAGCPTREELPRTIETTVADVSFFLELSAECSTLADVRSPTPALSPTPAPFLSGNRR